MVLSNIQPSGGPGGSPARISREREAESAPPPDSARANNFRENLTGGVPMNEKIQLGRDAAKLNSSALLLERILSRTQIELPAETRQLFEAAGKADFEASVAPGADGRPLDTSPEATAGRIVDGITGYIFKAWQMRNPEMTEESFQRFQTQVMKGFEQGLDEAKDILAGLQALTPELEESIGQTESLVRSRLDEFFQSTIEAIRQNAQQ